MSFKDTQSYKELQSDWRWIHEMDPEAAAAADQWVKEHPEEWKELEHMLYYSEANFHKRSTGYSGGFGYKAAPILQSGSVPAGGSTQRNLQRQTVV